MRKAGMLTVSLVLLSTASAGAAPLDTSSAHSGLRTFQSEASAAGLFGLKRELLRFRPRSDRRLVHTVSRLETRAGSRLEDAVDGEVPKLLRTLGLFV